MIFGRKKSSAIDQRLKDLEGEMARLNGEIKAAARQSGAARSISRRAQVANVHEAQPDGELARPDRERSGHVERGSGNSRNVERDFVPMPGHERDKFVNYFAAGNFNDLRPMRQDASVLKNKAIMMAVLATVALVGLLFHLFGR